MLGNYTIAHCDVLGFKQLIEKTPLNGVLRVTDEFRKLLDHAVRQDSYPTDVPSFELLQDHPHLGIAWFSDTILIYTLKDNEECLKALLQAVAWLSFTTMFTGNGTRIRSGIAYGEAFMDKKNSLYVGQPIVDAFNMEKQQAWAGGALTKEAINRLPANVRDGHFYDWPVLPYDVPIKTRDPRKSEGLRTIAVDWTYGLHRRGTKLEWSPQSPNPTKEDWDNRPDVCLKWTNTVQFHADVCRQCNPSNHQRSG